MRRLSLRSSEIMLTDFYAATLCWFSCPGDCHFFPRLSRLNKFPIRGFRMLIRSAVRMIVSRFSYFVYLFPVPTPVSQLAELSALNQVTVPDLWQQQAVAALREGKDVVVHAPTGAGKTLVFELWTNGGRNR